MSYLVLTKDPVYISQYFITQFCIGPSLEKKVDQSEIHALSQFILPNDVKIFSNKC